MRFSTFILLTLTIAVWSFIGGIKAENRRSGGPDSQAAAAFDMSGEIALWRRGTAGVRVLDLSPRTCARHWGRREQGGESCPQAIFAAIREVESGGDNFAVGDNGMSRGPYQISSAYWQDAIMYGGVQWDYHVLVWSRPHCEQVMLWYWQRYGAKTDEQCIRLHNGGPSMNGTNIYWQKVGGRL